MAKLNFILLILTTASALYVVDLRLSIQKEVDLLGKGREKAIRLAQDYADLQYARSSLVDLETVDDTVVHMNMHTPEVDEVFELTNKK